MSDPQDTETRRPTVAVPDYLDDRVQYLVDTGVYESKSQFYRHAAQMHLADLDRVAALVGEVADNADAESADDVVDAFAPAVGVAAGLAEQTKQGTGGAGETTPVEGGEN